MYRAFLPSPPWNAWERVILILLRPESLHEPLSHHITEVKYNQTPWILIASNIQINVHNNHLNVDDLIYDIVTDRMIPEVVYVPNYLNCDIYQPDTDEGACRP